MRRFRIVSLLIVMLAAGTAIAQAGQLKLHHIFSSHMVLQRDKPIKIWGWATPGKTVTVKLGDATATAKVQAAAPVNVFHEKKDYAGLGPWSVTFPARKASTKPITLVATCGNQKVELTDILIGDVWVMYGQSNMAKPSAHMDTQVLTLKGNDPDLRFFSIDSNEQASLQDDIRPEVIADGGWVVSTPKTASEFSAIGYVFGLNVQRSTGIPIGLIKSARGGASIEGLVPERMFNENPLTKRYADYIRKEMANFDPQKVADLIWAHQKARAKRRHRPEPKRPDPNNLRSWNIPAKSPDGLGSVYNGNFGVFKGFNIKGVVFNQGYNNAMSSNCRPRRYRILAKLMIEGIREDFNDPNLPFAILGFCAGGDTQNVDNFEVESVDGAPFIREAQRLGLADVKNQKNLVFIPAYDVKVPGLHPHKKRKHGRRAAIWALADIYHLRGADWRNDVKLLSAKPEGDTMVLTFSGQVISDTQNSIPKGFSIAGKDGKFYMAYARYAAGTNPWHDPHVIRVWSPLVSKPVAVRYAWARSPMGNLKEHGSENVPFPSFRTDHWDYPESPDPAVCLGATTRRQRLADAQARLEKRRLVDAEKGMEILKKLPVLEVPSADAKKKTHK